MKTNKQLAIGNWVHCILYGGKDGVIYAIHGEQAPESVRTMGGVMQTGGNAEFDIVWENGTESRRIPECIILGVQWHRREELADAPAEVIATMREFAAAEGLRKKAEATAAAEKFAADCEALKTNPAYNHIEQIKAGTYGSCGKLVASNLRKEFKKFFPGVKFSVRKEHHGSVRIEWTDGPTIKEVEAVSGKYSGGYFDGMDDSYKHERSPFTSVFGSAQYIFENRHHSIAEMQKAVLTVCTEYGWEHVEVKENSDGTAYVSCDYDGENKQRKVYDFIEKRHEYEVRVQ